MSADLVSRLATWTVEAGAVARAHFRRTGGLEFKRGREAVTEADRRIEALLRARIAASYPADHVVGEEFGGPAAGASGPDGRVWHIDPIDGTLNFALGMPEFCTSVALVVGDHVEAACVHQPLTGDTFTAVRGGGASLNGTPLAVSGRAPLAEAVVSIQLKKDGLLVDRPEILQALVRRTLKVRKIGAIALELAWVAAGFYDGLIAGFRQPIQPYDVAAGRLLVTEAGGTVTDFAGAAYRAEGASLLASNGAIHAELLDLLAPCRG